MYSRTTYKPGMNIEWIEDWEAGKAKAREQKKPIFLYLYSPT